MANRVVTVTEFKAKCLALLDEVDEKGGTITVTRRGKPLATVGPARQRKWRSPEGILAGKIDEAELERILSTDTTELWDALRPGALTDLT